jgi:hypothetical protein
MHNKSIERLGRDVEQSSHSATIAIVLTQQKRKQHKSYHYKSETADKESASRMKRMSPLRTKHKKL